MALGIYKPGQGYWVRVLSAVGFGLLTLATAAWVWGETSAIDLPNKAWTITVRDAEGLPSEGQTLTALVPAIQTDDLLEAGTVRVESFVPGEFSTRVTVVEPALNEGLVPSDLAGLRGDGFTGVIGDGAVQPIPVIEPLYVQGTAAGLVMLLGAILIFYFVGVKPSSSEFLIQTDGEMKKVNWSTRREVLGSTWVVIAASFLIAAVLYAVDYGFQAFFVAIDVLRR